LPACCEKIQVFIAQNAKKCIWKESGGAVYSLRQSAQQINSFGALMGG